VRVGEQAPGMCGSRTSQDCSLEAGWSSLFTGGSAVAVLIEPTPRSATGSGSAGPRTATWATGQPGKPGLPDIAPAARTGTSPRGKVPGRAANTGSLRLQGSGVALSREERERIAHPRSVAVPFEAQRLDDALPGLEDTIG